MLSYVQIFEFNEENNVTIVYMLFFI